MKKLKKTIKKMGRNIDNKFNVSKKLEILKKQVSRTTERAGNKLEYVLDGKITFDTFSKVELRIGEIKFAKKVENSDRLLQLIVSFNEDESRQIISGIADSYAPEEIVGKQALFVTNIEPRRIFNLESDGMILGVRDIHGKFSMLSADKEISIGTKAS
ncbi:MAG: hypothetical protein KAI16_00350 [Candidatus Pacebacteria bacterium]|nr:hypothetical protein [Candidatus Paceibacterota bacterium]